MIDADSWERVAHAATFDPIAPEHQSMWRVNHQRVCAGETLVWEFDIIGLKGVRRSMETHASLVHSQQPPSADLSQLIDVDQPVLTVKRQRHRTAAIGADPADLQVTCMVDREFAV